MTDASAGPPQRVVRNRIGRFRIWTILIVVVAALVAFFAVSQLRAPENLTEDLSAENEGDLARILASLSSESTAQQEQLSLLKVELANLQNASTAQGAASQTVDAQFNSLQVLSGTVPCHGPGLEIEISDPRAQVTYDVIVDTVEELRDAGAEALAVNGKRVGVASYFGGGEGRVTLDDVQLAAPFTVSAIGPAATMEGGLQIPGGSLDTLKALANVSAEVHRLNSLTLPALATMPEFKVARPQ